MPRDPDRTRTAILDAAEALILDQGFAATSVDKLIARAGVTKGAFFHHFASKGELGHALVERFAARDRAVLEQTMARAEQISRDPAQQVIVMVGLLREQFLGLTVAPGCLFASYCYESGLFDAHTHAVIRGNLRLWRERVSEKLRRAAERRPPRVAVELDSLADMLTGVVEGAFILSRMENAPQAVAEQLGHYRNYLELLFAET